MINWPISGVRNIEDYNARVREGGARIKEDKLQQLPYIIMIIDELADLMMVAAKEVETPIARLTQMARAVGIHLILATQRPSVDVITGVIKANFPARDRLYGDHAGRFKDYSRYERCRTIAR